MAGTVTSDSRAQYLTLGIDQEIFAVDVERVREIISPPSIARVPQAPPFLLGVIDVRGRAVPVIDLRIKLGLCSTERTDQTRIVVLDITLDGRARTMGVLTDRVFEVTSLDEGAPELPPEVGTRWRSEYIRGIGRRLEKFVIIFDLPRLFSTEEAALIADPVENPAARA